MNIGCLIRRFADLSSATTWQRERHVTLFQQTVTRHITCIVSIRCHFVHETQGLDIIKHNAPACKAGHPFDWQHLEQST